MTRRGGIGQITLPLDLASKRKSLFLLLLLLALPPSDFPLDLFQRPAAAL